MEFKQNDLEFTINIKHLSFSALFAEGRVHPSQIQRWIEAADLFALKRLFPNGENIIYVAQWNETNYTKHFRDFEIIDNFHKFFPSINRALNLRSTPIAIGDSSIIINGEMIEENSGKVLVTRRSQYVAINVKTAKSTNLHEFGDKNILSKISTFEAGNFSRTLTVYNIPNNARTFCYSTELPYNAVDINDHITNTHYILLMLDAFYAAVKSQEYDVIPNDKSLLQTARFSHLFIKDCKPLDIMHIKLWQNHENPYLFHFHAMVNDALVHQAEILFSQISSKL